MEKQKLKWTDLKFGDIIRPEEDSLMWMVVGIDPREHATSHILAGCRWFTDKDLEGWEKVENA
jgi:hypothetical protein